MAQELSPAHRPWMHALLARPYMLAAVMLLAVLVVPVCLRRQSDLMNVYLPAAQRLQRGEELFQEGYFYPPVFAWLMTPFANLPPAPARILWLALNGLALMVLVRGAWRLSGGGRLQGYPAVERREHLIFVLGLLVAVYYVIDGLTSQQNDLLVAVLVLFGCQALAAHRDRGAGMIFGLAAGLKCTPLLWAGYLVWRRKWLASFLVVVVAIGVNLLPDLTHPSATSQCRLKDWGLRFLVPMGDRGHDLGTWAAAINCNHSLPGMTNRLLTWEQSWQGGRATAVRQSERVAPETLKAVALGSILLCVLPVLVNARRRLSSSGATPSPEALEFSLVLILMLLMSPQSSKPHFCTLLLPGFCLARAALAGRSRLLLGLLLGAVTCGLLSNKDLVGGRIYDWVVWNGSITLSTLLLHAGCCVALFRSRRGTNSSASGNADQLSALHQAA